MCWVGLGFLGWEEGQRRGYSISTLVEYLIKLFFSYDLVSNICTHLLECNYLFKYILMYLVLFISWPAFMLGFYI